MAKESKDLTDLLHNTGAFIDALILEAEESLVVLDDLNCVLMNNKDWIEQKLIQFISGTFPPKPKEPRFRMDKSFAGYLVVDTTASAPAFAAIAICKTDNIASQIVAALNALEPEA